MQNSSNFSITLLSTCRSVSGVKSIPSNISIASSPIILEFFIKTPKSGHNRVVVPGTFESFPVRSKVSVSLERLRQF